MIGFLKGRAEDAGKSSIIVHTEGGVGYIVHIPLKHKQKALGKEVSLFTHLVAKDPSMELFGFPTQEEYSSFLLLLTVSGIGPRGALSILDTINPKELLSLISIGDADTLSKGYGIGKKQADRLIVELQSKVGISSDNTHSSDLVFALLGLGYGKSEIQKVLGKVSGKSFDEQLREALKLLSVI